MGLGGDTAILLPTWCGQFTCVYQHCVHAQAHIRLTLGQGRCGVLGKSMRS